MLKNKSIILILAGVFLSLLLFVGCDDKNNTDYLTTAVADDGEAPKAPEWLEAQPEFLFSNENPDNNTKYFNVFLRWKPVSKNTKGEDKSNIVAYKVYRNEKSQAIGVVKYGNEQFEDNDIGYLQKGKRVTYYISAVDSEMRETMSGPQTVDLQTYGAEPQPPMNFYLVEGSGNQVTLSWDEPENAEACKGANDAISKYRIIKKKNDGSWTTIAMIPAERTFYIDEGLGEGNIYYYQVSAVTASGNVSLPSDERSIVVEHSSGYIATRPTGPEEVNVMPFESSVNPYASKITWKKPIWNDDGMNGKNLSSDVVAYRIYRASNSSFNLENAWDLNYEPLKIVYNNYSYIDNSIDWKNDAKYYYYRVSAINSHGIEGDLSAPSTIYLGNTTTATKTPEGFRAVTDNSGKVTFYWEFDPDVEEYYIYKSKNGIIFDSYKTIVSRTYSSSYSKGDEVSYVDQSLMLSDYEKMYFKLQAYDHNTSRTRSNLSYFVKAEKPIYQTSDRIVLQAEDLVNSAQVRSVWYAWYSNELYTDPNIAIDSLWGYDIQQGEHYNLGTKTVFNTDDGKNYECLYFETMGRQVPPQESSPSNLFTGISDEVTNDDFVYTDIINNNSAETTAIESVRVVYPYDTGVNTGTNRVSDSVRPIFKAKPKLSSNDSYNYYYISAYNDDGLTYWDDIAGDGVGADDFYYITTQYPLLQHGMEGKDLTLDYDVDPWTSKSPENFANYRLYMWDMNYDWNYQYYEDWYTYHIPYYDFWYILSYYKTRDFKYYYWYNAPRNIDNWPSNNYADPMYLQVEMSGEKQFVTGDLLPSVSLLNGGCAYFIGPDSNSKFIAHDYFADNFKSYDWSAVYPIQWRENYFGPLYSDASPYYVGWWPMDAKQTNFTRNFRKDNTVTFNAYGSGIDYNDVSWIDPSGDNYRDIKYNTYDMYQEQIRFSWTPSEDGYYNVDMYFMNTVNSGNYFVFLKQDGHIIGTPAIINLSENADTVNSGRFNDISKTTDCPFDATGAKNGEFYKVYLKKNSPVEFYLSCMGSNNVTDVFAGQYNASIGSVFELYLDRIEIVKTTAPN